MASIVFQGVTKSFARAGRQMLLRSLLMQLHDGQEHERLVALRDISFELRDGESVAIVGRNGAGKSTLLNLIAGLSEPDSGNIGVEGRVAALLDLGAGFHPDLSGRENLYVNAALLGLRRKEAQQRYQSIVDFSGLGDFIDQPLRTYSSGMVVRLGFAVAVNVNPDILIIDEVLAVGDANFQEKCFAEIQRLKDSGTLFVCASHAAVALPRICKRALWLEQGELVMNGGIDDVLRAYKHDAHGVQIRMP
jgi:ABC-type polysaccharide/polyol phosphate transport system ATPase subunit